MRTMTYARLSLLIPFVIWVIFVLLLLLMSAMPESMNIDESMNMGDSVTFGDAILMFLLFYVLGIFFWLFPYILLALILFLFSYITNVKTILRLLVLSPIAMALLTVAVIVILGMGGSDPMTNYLSSGELERDWYIFILIVAGLAVLWGYLCVGIGYGTYTVLQYLGAIKDELTISSLSPVQEATG